MTNSIMVSKTVRLPDWLITQITTMAQVTGRSFTKMVEVIIENSLNATVEHDLLLIKQMQAKSVTPQEAAVE